MLPGQGNLSSFTEGFVDDDQGAVIARLQLHIGVQTREDVVAAAKANTIMEVMG